MLTQIFQIPFDAPPAFQWHWRFLSPKPKTPPLERSKLRVGGKNIPTSLPARWAHTIIIYKWGYWKVWAQTVGSFPSRSLLVSFPYLSGYFPRASFLWLVAFNCPVWPAAVRSAVAFTVVLTSSVPALKSRGLFAAQFTGVSVLLVSVSATTDFSIQFIDFSNIWFLGIYVVLGFVADLHFVIYLWFRSLP